MTDDRRMRALEAVARMQPDPVFVFDADGRYLEVLGGAERKLYDSGHFLPGRLMSETLPPAIAATFIEVIRRAIGTGELQIFEYQLGPADIAGSRPDGPGKTQWFEGRVAAIDLAGHDRPAVVWLAINITERKRMARELELLARADPLTGILNRRAFLEHLEAELSRVRRYGQPAALAILDIDHFKRVNDTFGHAVGDEVIIAVVRRVAERLRESDVFGRVGGEEFGILFPGIDAGHAHAALDRFRVAVRDGAISTQGGPVPVTVSAGVSDLVSSDGDGSEALKRADRALYEAKNGGRNQVRRG